VEPDPVPAPALDAGAGLIAPTLRIRKPRRGQRSRFVPALVSFVVAFLLTGAGVWAVYWALFTPKAGSSGEAQLPNTQDANFRFVLPSGAWKSDSRAVSGLNVNCALTRSAPPNSYAIYYRDFKTRMPTAPEIQDTTLTKLRSYFQPLEWEPKVDSPNRLGGQSPALHVDFEGTDPNGIPMSGECMVVAYKGLAYWFFTWCPTAVKDAASPEWETIRAGFSLLDAREYWQETPRKPEYHEVEDLPFEQGYFRENWTPQKADRWDPNARLAFLGRDPSEKFNDAKKAASYMVIVRDKEDGLKSAVDAAKKYFKDQQLADYPDTVIRPIKDKKGVAEDRPATLGTEQGQLVKMQVQNHESRERYVVLGIIPTPQHVLILRGECDYGRKDYWDLEFMALIKSFRRQTP
jgi:hypothetical protein